MMREWRVEFTNEFGEWWDQISSGAEATKGT